MALSIRFSVAPFREELPPAHRGEILFEHARNLVQEEWDRPSIAAAQAYVLLGTYKLQYGGARQAFLYLGYAVNMLKVLRLLDADAEVDPVRLECSRRLACTISLMDRFVALSLSFTPHLTEEIPMMMTDDDFWALKRREPGSPNRKTSVNQEILRLSELLVAVSTKRNGFLDDLRAKFERIWAEDPSQQYSSMNLEYHRQKDTLRSFLHMHLLYHHIGQLLYFPAMGPCCHHHARAIAGITEYAWTKGGFDLHNFMAGQILTLASIILSHALLTEPAAEDERRRGLIRETIVRVRHHTRMFNWVLQRLDEWEAKTTTLEVFQNENLLDDILFLGRYRQRSQLHQGGSH
ncbi:hypothetical protein ACHAQA_006124 [Verticillium albo-atrum]